MVKYDSNRDVSDCLSGLCDVCMVLNGDTTRLPICNEKTQTLSYYGVLKEVIKDFVINDKPSGIDRFVPIGKSMDFTLIWDVHDLIRELTRKISVV